MRRKANIVAAVLIGGIAGFALANSDLTILGRTDFSRWGPDAWNALAAGITALVAVAAATVAISQLGEARRLRLEQAQPYAVIHMVADTQDPQVIYLVLQNFGTTAALDLKVQITPDPTRSPEVGGDQVWLPDAIPVLAPGQQWRTFWDFSPARAKTSLPTKHAAELTYRDARGTQHKTRADLDWAAYDGRRWVTRRGIHDVGEALREINKTTRKWTEGPRGGLAVFVRDGEAKDEKANQAFLDWKGLQSAATPAGAPEHAEAGDPDPEASGS